jgi:hypothetical protein
VKTITINVPIERPRSRKMNIEQRTGYVALLAIGDKKEKFILQINRATGKPDALVHYASGYRFGGLTYYGLTARQAAEQLVTRAITQHGLDKVREVMASKPVLNT